MWPVKTNKNFLFQVFISVSSTLTMNCVKCGSESTSCCDTCSARFCNNCRLELQDVARNKVVTKQCKSCRKDTPEQQIVRHLPVYKFKGIDKFYDISGILEDPTVFQLVVDRLANVCRRLTLDYIGGIDARGFVLGPCVALALKKPFFMIRKEGKLPNSVSGRSYTKEYKGEDTLCVSKAIDFEGKKVVLVDDLIATGGSMAAAIDLMKSLKADVVACLCVVHLEEVQTVDISEFIYSLVSESDF